MKIRYPHRLPYVLWRAVGVAFLLTAMTTTTVWSLPTGATFAQPRHEALFTATVAPGFDGIIHRLQTRAERSMGRAGSLFWDIGVLWLWVVLSSGLFLLVSAVSSVVDVRMFGLRRHGPAAVSHYLGHGTRMFFRLLRDRRTPYLARSVVLLALLYWLVPADLIPDSSGVPGFADDVVIAIGAGKAFMYLCPDALIQNHADAVEAEARV